METYVIIKTRNYEIMKLYKTSNEHGGTNKKKSGAANTRSQKLRFLMFVSLVK